MFQLKYKTRGNSLPGGKPRVYISDHCEKDSRWRDVLIAELLELCDCVVFYCDTQPTQEQEEAYKADLNQMQMIVIPVTNALFAEDNYTLQTDLPYALEHKIGVLPIVVEGDILEAYGKVFGQIQFLNRSDMDSTARSYREKLASFLKMALFDEEQVQQIRKVFDSYIFLSYRKKDRKYANELMRIIHNMENFSNVAIWYDEYLIPGEDFTVVIDKALQDAPVFMLAVTPNLLSPGNYVMECEYPAAVRHNKPVLPVMMQSTDQEELQAAYRGIPECADPENGEMLREALHRCFRGVPLGNHKNDPEHMYLIGLAYLSGIDVEVDRSRAADYIEQAAIAGNLAAMEKISEMYTYGIGVARDWTKALVWRYRLHQVYQQAYWGCAFSKKDCPITPEDRRILQNYLENLQYMLVDAPYAGVLEYAELTWWAKIAFENFVDTESEKITDPEAAEIVASVRLSGNSFYSANSKALVKCMKELCRQENSEKRKILLARAYMCNGDFRKAEKLYRGILKKNKDAQVMLYLAQCLNAIAQDAACCSRKIGILRKISKLFEHAPGFLWDIYYVLDRKCNAYQKQMLVEALQLCREITENNQNFPAIRVLAEIWDKHRWKINSEEYNTLFWQTYEQMKQIYLQTKEKDDLDLLRQLCWVAESITEDVAQKALYAQRRGALTGLDSNRDPNQNKQATLRYAVQLARQANERNLKSAGDWDYCVCKLDKDWHIYVPSDKIIPEMADLLRCALRSAVRGGAHLSVDRAETVWRSTADPDVADVYIDILMEQALRRDCSLEEAFTNCTKAMGVFCEMVSLDWRLCTWQKQLFPDHDLARKQEWFVGCLGRRLGQDPKVGEKTGAKNNSFIANNYLSALQEWEKGNLLQAVDQCFRMVGIDDEVDPQWAPVAARYELLAHIDNQNPARVINHLQKANAYRQKAKGVANKVSIAINYSLMADAALQMDDGASVRTYLEKAAGMYYVTTDRSYAVMQTINDRYRALIRDLAPKEAAQKKRVYLSNMKGYLYEQTEIDKELAGEYVATLPEDVVPDYEDLSIVMALALVGPREEDCPYVSRLLYNWLCDSTYNYRGELIQYLETCVDRDGSLENRRYFAKIAERVPMLPAEALAEDAVARAAWIGRLEKAKTLLAEVEQQWTEEDAVLFRDIQHRLSRAMPEAIDDKIASEKQHEEDHAIEDYRKNLFAAVEFLVDCYSCHASKWHKQHRKESLRQLLELAESPLLESLSNEECDKVYWRLQSGQEDIRSTKICQKIQQIRTKLVRLLYERQKTQPNEERKAMLRVYGEWFVQEGLVTEDHLWLAALYKEETQGADAKDLALYNAEYASIYMALGLYDKAKELHIAYIESEADEEPWQQGNAIAVIFDNYVQRDRWKEANLFFKKLLAVYELCIKEDNEGWAASALHTKIGTIGDVLHRSTVTDKDFIVYFGESLESLENLVKEKRIVWPNELVRMYCESGRKILGKRAIALAKELKWEKWEIDQLRKDIKRNSR